MQREFLQRVLQRPVSPRALMPARLKNWRRCAIRGHDFPGIVRGRGAMVDGVILDRVTAADHRKLVAYEGEGYTTGRAVAELASGRRRQVLLFVPRPGFYILTRRRPAREGGRRGGGLLGGDDRLWSWFLSASRSG